MIALLRPQDEMLQLIAVSLWSISRALSVMDHNDMIMWKRDAQAWFLEINNVQLESSAIYTSRILEPMSQRQCATCFPCAVFVGPNCNCVACIFFITLAQALNYFVTLHLQCWQHLASRCQNDGVYLFRLRPKTHYLHHIGRDAERTLLNPRLPTSCFYDESYLGHIKGIAKHCHSGTMIRERFWQRYFLFLSLRFHQRRTNSR